MNIKNDKFCINGIFLEFGLYGVIIFEILGIFTSVHGLLMNSRGLLNHSLFIFYLQIL